MYSEIDEGALSRSCKAKSFAIPLIPPAPFLLDLEARAQAFIPPAPRPLMGLECCFNDQIILLQTRLENIPKESSNERMKSNFSILSDSE